MNLEAADLEDSTPIIVGVGQFSEKNVAPEVALSPMGLAAEASRIALADTGAAATLVELIDTIAVVRLFSDSTNRPRLSHGFGRADNPPRAVARRLGADPDTAIYGQLGGNTPQKLVNEMAERIARGDVRVALLTGAEAIRTTQSALRAGTALDWDEHDDGTLEDRGLGEPLTTAHEFEYGIGIPVQTYPLFENVIRARCGRSVEDHQLAMGRLMQPFAQMAAANPHAFYGRSWTAEQLAAVDQDNRYVCFPYPKLMNARDSVNQSAGVIMTSVAMARQLQIEQSKWVFLHGCAEADDRLVTERSDLGASPAIRANACKALTMAGKSVADMSYFDVYSCFPSAVEIACQELGIAVDDERGLTVTGGLPFFGGPGNNYSMHGIVSMVERLRERPGTFGLVTANGGWLSKHATGIYSTQPWPGGWQRENPASYQGQVDSAPVPPFTESPQGAARIETYTVCFDRDGPQRGFVIGRLDSTDQRFLADLPADLLLLQKLVEQEAVGLPGRVGPQQGRNLFHPAGFR
jgi:acetyl-CoA C-acetyltransferase